ncbi:MAG: hypothetical protein L0J57_10275 [Brachybacterium sp.]|uniref:hypothetical protein n=1 Tax=Brachybacterium sp. TaxID=1891286 RepID=UPI00264B093F|nr:hypothetical protein [Brachybacterium sp.]MDN6329136.1 hypothetical protein [Brachybacterium sp.]
MPAPSLLVISLSPIHRDARVLRQLSVVAEFGHVTTIGYGPKPEGSDEHLQVPDGLSTLPQTPLGIAKLALRRLRAAELEAPASQWVLKAVKGRRFDIVVANEARILALADAVAGGAPIWADMHEWAPEERTHILSWRLLVAPLMDHLCRTYLPRCAAITTVGDRIGELYRSRYGVEARTMRNSSPYRDLPVGEVADDAVRLVHSGAAVQGRNLELTIDVVSALPERFSLDLYLVPANDGGRYLRSLTERAPADGRVRFLDPVPPMMLPDTLNGYDLGVFWLPPVHTNGRLTLPNKYFDYVQARLGIAVGPSPEMADLTERHGLGVVAEGFSPETITASLRDVTAEEIRSWKRHADSAAHELSFAADAQVARDILGTLLAG